MTLSNLRRRSSATDFGPGILALPTLRWMLAFVIFDRIVKAVEACKVGLFYSSVSEQNELCLTTIDNDRFWS